MPNRQATAKIEGRKSLQTIRWRELHAPPISHFSSRAEMRHWLIFGAHFITH
jgi:hypothetical protein